MNFLFFISILSALIAVTLAAEATKQDTDRLKRQLPPYYSPFFPRAPAPFFHPAAAYFPAHHPYYHNYFAHDPILTAATTPTETAITIAKPTITANEAAAAIPPPISAATSPIPAGIPAPVSAAVPSLSSYPSYYDHFDHYHPSASTSSFPSISYLNDPDHHFFHSDHFLHDHHHHDFDHLLHPHDDHHHHHHHVTVEEPLTTATATSAAIIHAHHHHKRR